MATNQRQNYEYNENRDGSQGQSYGDRRHASQSPPPPPGGNNKSNFYYQSGNDFSFDGILGDNSQAYFYMGDLSKEQMIKQFMFANVKKFPDYRIGEMRAMLENMDEQQVRSMVMTAYKSPETMLLISVLLGYLGIDRFLIDNIVEGVLKLVLTICCGLGLVWWIVDMFLIQNLTREYNFKQFMMRAGLF